MENVPLREFAETLIRLEIDKINIRLSAIDRATELQTTELARRLSDLNHAHQKAVEDRAQFLTREIFDETQQETRRWRDLVAETLAEAKGTVAGAAAEAAAKVTEAKRQAVINASVISAVAALMGTILGHFWK